MSSPDIKHEKACSVFGGSFNPKSARTVKTVDTAASVQHELINSGDNRGRQGAHKTARTLTPRRAGGRFQQARGLAVDGREAEAGAFMSPGVASPA